MLADDQVFTRNLSGLYQIENNQIDVVAMPFELGLERDSLEYSKVNSIYP